MAGGGGSAHEVYEGTHHAARSSNRTFGLVFTAFLAIVAFLRGLHGVSWHGFAIAAVVILAITLTVPRILRPFNGLWTKLGFVLNRIVSPVIIAGIFYVAIAPIGLLMRLLGKDPMRRDLSAPTYWIDRVPPGPAPNSMRRQF